MNMPIKMVKDLENLPSYLCLNASQDQSSQTQPPVYLTPESDGIQNHKTEILIYDSQSKWCFTAYFFFAQFTKTENVVFPSVKRRRPTVIFLTVSF